MHLAAVTYLIGFLLIVLSFLLFILEDPKRFQISINSINKIFNQNESPKSIFNFIFLIGIFWPVIAIFITLIYIFQFFKYILNHY